MRVYTPWSKEVERMFDNIARIGKYYTEDIQFTRNLGRRAPDLFDEQNGYMDIARIGKSRKSVVIPRPGVQIVPMPLPDSEAIKVRQKKRWGIYRL